MPCGEPETVCGEPETPGGEPETPCGERQCSVESQRQSQMAAALLGDSENKVEAKVDVQVAYAKVHTKVDAKAAGTVFMFNCMGCDA